MSSAAPQVWASFSAPVITGAAKTKAAAKSGRWDAPFDEAPEGGIREEIFSVERLESHAQSLALEHIHATASKRGRRLAPRVRDNGRVLANCFRELSAAAVSGSSVPPAAKWLLDNFHLVSGLEKSIQEDLPSAYYRELPKLNLGELRGYPRVYALAWKWVAHCDSHFDSETLRRFIGAYQRTQPLTIGELWALPITLRIVLLENLRRQSENVLANLRARQRADLLADLLLGLGTGAPLDPKFVVKRLSGRLLPLAFSLRLSKRLSDQDAPVSPILNWLATPGTRQLPNAEAEARQEHQDQLTRNATVKNAINSLRAIALFDWPAFVEDLSLVDGAFRAAFDFQGLSFATRDRYRHTVESLGRGSPYSQIEIARFAAENVVAAKAGGCGDMSQFADVGYHLIGPGTLAFEKQTKYSPPLSKQAMRLATSFGAPLYLGSLAMLSLWALSLPLGSSVVMGLGGAHAIFMALLALLPASEIAVSLANHSVMKLWLPRSLPKLALKGGVPLEFRTMVVVPVMLEDLKGLAELVETLELHFLANADGEIFFGLLSDWPDAQVELKETETALLQSAYDAVAELNRRHGRDQGQEPRFGLYQRRRLFNESQGAWMGWERKRGKLTEFNRLLRGAEDTSYIASNAVPPKGVRFVITLDQDTRLPLGAALKLVGTMAHPLNQPRLNPEANRVIRGYGILQPRISPTLLAQEEATLFNRLSSGRAGADPYAFAVSDVYQDLFGEGSYTGKGIYDVDAFEASLAGRVPENRLLSHDLFEGCFARAALVSDVEFFEEFPCHYQSAAACKERWTRGDWQLLPWILGIASGPRESLGPMGRWKMIDNLRRSLLAPLSLLALWAAWFLEWRHAMAWTILVMIGLALPPLLSVLVTELIPRRRDFSLRNHWRSLRQDLGAGLLKFVFSVAMLPCDAWLMSLAICKALFRLLLSHKMLLQWTPSRSARRGQARTWPEFISLSKAGPVAGALLCAALLLARPPAWPLALPFAFLWVFSPVLCRFFSLPRPLPALARLSSSQAAMLRSVARRTWHYFETFVDESVSQLPPDNFQEDPRAVVANRTSPTNLGLYLLSCIAAHDFGWLAPHRLLDRIEKALDSMELMEKHQGHFFNWYELKNLSPLEPRFVSTVDSGNLAGHLLVARQAMLELSKAPIVPKDVFSGMNDSLTLLRNEAGLAEFTGRAGSHQRELRVTLDALAAELRPFAGAESPQAPDVLAKLRRIHAQAEILRDIGASLGQEHSPEEFLEFLRWSRVFCTELAGQIGYAQMMLADAPSGFNPSLDGAAAAYRTLGKSGPARYAAEFAARVKVTASRMQALVDAMRFGFLYDSTKKLFSIGFRSADTVLDSGCYDLLASEARLTSFLAVARKEVDTEHWFRLGRTLTPLGSSAALLSWSGSMFEYLMPLLVMKSPPGSLLSETYGAVVKRQIQFGKERGLPWGVSESACNIRDKDMTYQYSDFGVEGLGIKRGVGRHKVVAPYATALALMVDPVAAVENFKELTSMGALGAYGFVEALDFGTGLFPVDRPWALVRTWMAHHQGMSLVAILNVLKGGLMQSRFQAVPMLKAASLLLQERTSRNVALSRPPSSDDEALPTADAEAPELQRNFDSPHSALPQTHLLCNGNYAVMLTVAGGGYSRWKDLCITRFRPDPSRDPWGSFIYMRNLKGGEAWSAAFLPSRKEPDSYKVLFREDKAEITRRDGALESKLEVAVSPEDDVEVRRLTLRNHGLVALELELTSFAEVSLSDSGADLAHPAFAKLFVQTEYAAEYGALLAHRRPRDSNEKEIWAAHLSFSDSSVDGVHFETDRARFLGRGNDILDPDMMKEGRLLSNTVGSVLDPIFSIRRRLKLEPGAVANVTFATMAAPSREKVCALAAKIKDGSNVERLFGQAWIHAQVQLRNRGIQPEEATLFQILAGHLFYPDRRLRGAPEMLSKNRLGAKTLWGQGISSDLPILLLRIDEAGDREILRQLILAWQYWRLKNLAMDLVILNEEPVSYAADFQKALEDMASQGQAQQEGPKAGAIHVIKSSQLPDCERDLFLCAAKVILHAGHGSLAEQLARVPPQPSSVSKSSKAVDAACPPLPAQALEFPNGLGGFADGGREYRICLEEGQQTPAPWINIIANEGFGFQVSESGAGYTWCGNSRENKLSPWSNDPVTDPAGEAIYVRDEDSGALFTPTALPIRLKGGRYVSRHGQGYSSFESTALGIQMSLTQFVPMHDPVKLSCLRLKNLGNRSRRLSLTAYTQWVLGTSAQDAAHWVQTEMSQELGLLTAKNPFNPDYPQAIAFFDVGGGHRSYSTDRREFLGRHGTLKAPMSLEPGMQLSAKTGVGLDPCAALQSYIELKPGESREFRVILGQARDAGEMQGLVKRYRVADLDSMLSELKAFWDATLGAVQVKTPDRAMDIMLNRWLPYQTLSGRIWARTGFYQCGGAYGFRDQLQDVLALIHSRPEITKAQIFRASEKQFVEGDVLHWWHPPSGAGVRTRITDDRLWLPYAAKIYVDASGDVAAFDESSSFLEGPGLLEAQAELYFQPSISKESGSLFEHCARALDCSLDTGAHGLPLMGGGDWNDGMNKVGAAGRGESVWLAWFLAHNLRNFAPLAEARGEIQRAQQWLRKADEIVAAAELQGWDGEWYRRAFFDDGSPLGSAGLAECRIDSIAQSWAVLSGVADPPRAARAMAALEEHLWKKSDRLMLLLSPPFVKSRPDPGYIMGYLSGIRENGGQYNHAAAWNVAALAALGEGAKAHDLFAMLNPVGLAGSRAGMQRYKLEPYVMAGDVYSQAPHVGRGGWSWYTGSAAWMQRVGVESILGLTLHGDSLKLGPCIPGDWPGFELDLKWGDSRLKISVLNPHSVCKGLREMALDGKKLDLNADGLIEVPKDGLEHHLEAVLGPE